MKPPDFEFFRRRPRNILETSGAAWQTIRNYLGIAPGSSFEFTVWSDEPLPERPFFRMEIKQTGEFRAQERSPDTIVLSKFLLSEVYDLPEGTLTELMVRSASFRRGNDPRLQHFVGVEPEFVRVESSRRWRDARQRREFGDRRAEVRVR